MSARRSSPVLTSAAIRAWLEVPGSRRPTTPEVKSSIDWARGAWYAARLPSSDDVAELLPDRLYALLRVIGDDLGAVESRIRAWYQLIEAVDWPGDLFAEKADLLSQLGYLAWRQAFRNGQPAATLAWEDRVAALAARLPSVPEFMALAEGQRTDRVRRRFLSDPVILIAECRRVLDLTNRNPSEALLEAKAAYAFLVTPGSGWSFEEHAYFQAISALAIGVAEKELGNFASSATWLDQAETLCPAANNSEAIRSRIDFARKALAYQLRQWERALDGTAELKARFARLQSARFEARCTFVEGIALKELGRESEALPKLLEVATSKGAGVERWLRGWALMPAAEIYAGKGLYAAAADALSSAWELIRDTDVVATIAHFHATKAEILRDRGCFMASVESYRLAVDAYASGGLVALEAYVRVLLAETLLVAGENRGAQVELVKVIPMIESLGLVREAVVSVALLRESLARQEANAGALQIIKAELRRLENGGHP